MRHAAWLASTSIALALIALACAGCGPQKRPLDDDDGPCDPGSSRCRTDGFQRCVDGTWTTPEQCAGACDDQLGCVACSPNAPVCVNDDVHACNPDGTIGPLTEDCGSDRCEGGACQSPCVIAAKERSYIGCEYWAVDLDNVVDILGPPSPDPNSCTTYRPEAQLVTEAVCDDGISPFSMSSCDWNGECPSGMTCKVKTICANNGKYAPFAIVVSNPDDAVTVQVTVANQAGMTKTISVAPKSVATVIPSQLGFPDQSLDYSGIESKAYHITSDRPIIAYQFNPLNNVGVFTNDGSLLIPSSAYDSTYYVLTTKSLPRRPTRSDWNGFVTVVADDDQPTTVTITPTADTRQGTGVAKMFANTSQTFTLGPYQTVTLEAEALGDLSGTKVECSPSCGVFAGHEATNLGTSPSSGTCCADHLEDMVFPTSTWGKRYVVTMSAPRMTPTWDLVRVVAQKPDTTLQITPPPISGCGVLLQPGQWCEFYTQGNVEIQSPNPILVGHFLLSNGGIDQDSGDPALSFAIPVEQFRKDYTLLVPLEYDANYFAITVPAGGTAMLDGIDVTFQLQSFATGSFRTGQIQVTPGQHQLSCPDGCGVEASGWSEAVSYLYAGGLDLRRIVVE